MGLDLYFVKRIPPGEPVFPCWDETGNALPGIEFHSFRGSLRGARGDPRIYPFGLAKDGIDPSALMNGALKALQGMLGEVAALHPDFKALAEEVPSTNTDEMNKLLSAWELEEDWLGGDPLARSRASKLVREFEPARHLATKMFEAGTNGFFAYWSE